MKQFQEKNIYKACARLLQGLCLNVQGPEYKKILKKKVMENAEAEKSRSHTGRLFDGFIHSVGWSPCGRPICL
jgi:cytochrome c biogenesis protein CcdA